MQNQAPMVRMLLHPESRFFNVMAASILITPRIMIHAPITIGYTKNEKRGLRRRNMPKTRCRMLSARIQSFSRLLALVIPVKISNRQPLSKNSIPE